MKATTKLRYLSASTVKTFLRRGMQCPSCGGEGHTIDRKWLVTALRRCKNCQLLYRTPTTNHAESESFYQTTYEEGSTTRVPSTEELDALIASNFRGHDGDYSQYISILRTLGAGSRLFDYGCSWGYGSFQLGQAGFDVDAFEISEPRADYARRRLGVPVTSLDAAQVGTFDVFFSAHVIEHVPSVAEMMRFGLRLLKPGGLFVAFTPNGSDAYRQLQPRNWHALWGLVHPQLLDEVYLQKHLAERKMLIASSPYQQLQWGVNDLSGWELLIVIQA